MASDAQIRVRRLLGSKASLGFFLVADGFPVLRIFLAGGFRDYTRVEKGVTVRGIMESVNDVDDSSSAAG